MKIYSLFKGWRWQCYLLLIGALLFNNSLFAIRHSESIDNLQLIINNGAAAASQQATVSGVVSDYRGPLPGVTVSIKGTTVATITDSKGAYTIDAAAGDILIFSFVGYKTVEVTAAGTAANILLEEDATALKEVTINAGYYSVKDKKRTGSIAKITSKDIEKQPVTNVLATMQGQMAGVSIIQNSGMAGSGFNIEIRGQNSLRLDGNNPLYVIDGVPYASDLIGSSYTSGNMPQQNSPLNSINPGDIASIEVLKDADATAIYGSRGANGVVLITTKRGKEGKTQFNTTLSSGFGSVTRLMDLMHTPDYLAMRREAFANDGVTVYPDYAYDVNGTWSQARDTDWQEELLGGTSTYTTVQSSLTGGSAQTQFLVSGNYSKETTVFPGDFRYIKGNVHTNLSHESEDKRFKINFTSGYTMQDNDMPSIDLTRDAITLAPNAPELYDANGNLNWENNTFTNPVAILESHINSKTYDLIANTVLSYSLGHGLDMKSSFGYTDLRQNQLNAVPNTIYTPAYGLGSEVSAVFSNELTRNSWIVEPQVGWKHTFGNVKIDALAGGTFQNQTGNQLVTYGEGFASNSLINNPASAAFFTVLSSLKTQYRYQAFFGRVNFDWKDRYILNLTGRRDGSSRFGPGRQFATFGAVGAAWIFSNEPAIKNSLSFLSFGKLRASYGTAGNDQIGDYQYLDTYSTSGSTYQGISGMQPTRLYNPDFGWETNRKLEAEMETGFFNDRISTTIAWYRNRSSNQLVGIPLPGTTGFTQLQANLDATVENSGWEITLRSVNVKLREFSWTTNLNFTTARNRLVSFPGLEGSSYSNQFVIGEPLNIVKVYHYTGLNPDTGIYQFEDVNGDGSLSSADDKKTIKDLNPKFYGGLENQFRYGNVQLDFLFQFVKQLNFNENFRSGMPGSMQNQPAGVVEHWQDSGDSGPYQIYSDSNGAVSLASSRFSQSDAAIGDASFVRLKNISLSYDVPEKWTKKFSCKVSLQGQNLLTFTKYKGIDPEFKSAGYLPPLRIFTTSLQLTF
jgi:TonB-linked SusC/RagA family outer membrane protein